MLTRHRWEICCLVFLSMVADSRHREKTFRIEKKKLESRKIFQSQKKIMKSRKKKLKSRKIFRNRESYFKIEQNIPESSRVEKKS